MTGGAHGIGRALARRLYRDGTTVIIADQDGDTAKKVADEISGVAMLVDVGIESEIQALVDTVETDFGPIDMFVSNAGVGYGDSDGGAASMQGGLHPIEDRWSSCWQINVMAHVYAARIMVPRMAARGGGYLVNVASAAGLLSQIGDAAYSASKHAAVGFAESLAITHEEDGIHVSVVCPQAVATRMIGIDDDSNANDGGFGGNDVDGILSAETVADCIVDGVADGQFLILPHPQVATYFQRKAGDHDRWIRGMRRFRRQLASE